MTRKLDCILLIDDDEMVNYLNKQVIDNAGCTKYLRTIDDARDALKYLRKCVNKHGYEEIYPTPELIFLDLNMPGLNGWEFLDKYREISHLLNESIIIIMLTTSMNPNDIKQAEKCHELAGFNNKPLTMDKLDEILTHHFM